MPLNYQNQSDARREQGGVLRQLFGPSRNDIWGQFAHQLGAHFTPGLFERSLVASHQGWKVTMEVQRLNRRSWTCVRAAFANPDGLKFRLHRATIFTSLRKLLGLKPVVTGDRPFDSMFVLTSNLPELVRQLFDSSPIRESLYALPPLELTIVRDTTWYSADRKAGIDDLTC